MECVWVRLAFLVHIIPREQHRGARGDFQAGCAEQGFAATFRLVEVDHRSPAALPAALLFRLPVNLADMEIIMMALELLADGIALPLQRFALAGLHAHQFANPAVDAVDEGMPAVKIAAFGRAEVGIVSRGQQSRRFTIRIDHRDQAAAFFDAQEILDAVKIDSLALHRLDNRVARQARGGASSDFGKASKGHLPPLPKKARRASHTGPNWVTRKTRRSRRRHSRCAYRREEHRHDSAPIHRATARREGDSATDH